ncbi:MAG TPA: hypothetical protein PK054_12585 [Anaerohalosphaeraceae bacterium]|nr:hypothetical protein [Anaerohalosphaeraceae bacterium]HOL89998.1 hypothetical protein [Anaerohalosphaeraceae bacterium]HPP57402.1 hypothetical protein [Anaerohalosphaeraceae bacterium]
MGAPTHLLRASAVPRREPVWGVTVAPAVQPSEYLCGMLRVGTRFFG